jgi:hypothetical protein
MHGGLRRWAFKEQEELTADVNAFDLAVVRF